MRVEIDEQSGFCTGVVNAIEKAEEELNKGELYCVGDIVHNSLEMERLAAKGLKTIGHEELEQMYNCRVLFRAHGEPPASYETAHRNDIEVIDASCPVVLHLQKRIREAYEQIREENGQIVIYGKRGHAEVVGLIGQTNGTAIVVETEDDVDLLDFARPIVFFSQTTKSLEGFYRLADIIRSRGNKVTVCDTICRKVANRIPQLQLFAQQHDVIIFVSGAKSSNGRQLFSVCKAVNDRTYFVSEISDIEKSMIEGDVESVGISGATSTPRWVMEEIKEFIMKLDRK